MNKNQAAELLAKYKNETANRQERQLIERWFVEESAKQQIDPEDINYLQVKDKVWRNLVLQLYPKPVQLWKKAISIAAAIVLIVSVLTLIYFNGKHQPGEKQNTFSKSLKIIPGGKKAFLTLANGEVVHLNNKKNGLIIGAKGISYFDGETLKSKNQSLPISTQTLTASTPRGGTYEFILPDSTKVFLNAATVIKFPSVFEKLNRIVELIKGEAYFEVKKDPLHPFIVKSHNQEIKVLGTHFNVNCYDEESYVKTTLAEGSVQVTNNKLASATLKPGQQAINDEQGISVKKADLEVELAWKNGLFISQDKDFKSMMLAIGRWYDVEIVFDYEPKALYIAMQISRTRNIKEVLSKLESTGDVKFKIEGRRIIIVK